MASVTIPQIYATMRKIGASDEVAKHFCVIAIRETGGTLDLLSHKGPDPRDDSWGIYQLNRLPGAHPDVSVACATNLECSSQYALNMYRRNGWKDWAGDESHFPEYAARVDAELAGNSTLVPGDPVITTDPAATGQDNGIGQGIHDFMLAVTVELLSLTLIAIGLWGIANGNESAGGAVRSGTRRAFAFGKKFV